MATRPGDEIWLMAGLDRPLSLRAVEHRPQEGMYEFTGRPWIRELVRGQAISIFSEDEFKEVRII